MTQLYRIAQHCAWSDGTLTMLETERSDGRSPGGCFEEINDRFIDRCSTAERSDASIRQKAP